MSSSLRKPLALATVLAAGVVGGFAALPASASHPSGPSLGSKLTSANGGSILISGGTALAPRYLGDSGGTPAYENLQATDVQWSRDGSRAVFVDQFGELMTVRYNNGDDTWFVADMVDGVTKAHPTFRSSGSTIVWAEQDSGAWRLMLGLDVCCDAPVKLSPDSATDYSDPDAGPNGTVVYQKGSEVWLWDGSYVDVKHGESIDDHSTKVVDGADPAISPDGSKVAYVSGGHIWAANINGSGATQVDTDASPTYSNPTWSADGATIAFNSGTAVRTVPASGGASSAVAGLSGAPAYRSEQRDQVVRLAGPSRFATAAQVSMSHWKTANDASDPRPAAHAVVLSRSTSFADALGGSALAAAKEGPLLMTDGASLTPVIGAEISRVLGNDHTATVYILGGADGISLNVENQITAMGYNIDRIAGRNRFETAVKIAGKITTAPDIILVASGMNFPDALAAGAAAGSYDVPGTGLSAVVVLSEDSVLPADTKTYLDQHPTPLAPVFGIGGSAAKALTTKWGDNNPIWQPIAGSNRYQTAEGIAEVFFGGQHVTGIASGLNWPDGLSGGALLGTLNGPLLLSPGTGALPVDTVWNLSVNSPSLSTALVFGSNASISDAQAAQIGVLISGPAGSTQFVNSTNIFGVTAARSSASTAVVASTDHRTLAEITAAATAYNSK